VPFCVITDVSKNNSAFEMSETTHPTIQRRVLEDIESLQLNSRSPVFLPYNSVLAVQCSFLTTQFSQFSVPSLQLNSRSPVFLPYN
jgi:hypothetical protein